MDNSDSHLLGCNFVNLESIQLAIYQQVNSKVTLCWGKPEALINEQTGSMGRQMPELNKVAISVIDIQFDGHHIDWLAVAQVLDQHLPLGIKYRKFTDRLIR